MSTVGTELFPITGKIIIIKGERRFPEEAKCAEMNEKRQQAAGFLREYAILCRSEDVINEQMCVIDRAVQGASDGDVPDDRFNDQIGQREELRLRLAVVKMRREMISGMVDRLPPRQRIVIGRFFITGGSGHAADDIMEWLAIEKSQVYRIKDAALDSIYRMMTDGSVGAAMVE